MEKSVLKRLAPVNVLVVEDDELLCEEIVNALIPYCKNVISAADGKEGLELFYKGEVDVLVTDIHLPKMNGLKMVENIRTVNQNLPVIVLTAYDTSDNIGKSIDMEVISFLHKPFDIEQLYNALLMASGKLSTSNHLLTLDHDFIYDYRNKVLMKNREIIHFTRLSLIHI